MSTVVKTTEEFSTRRKLRYGAGETKTPYTISSSSMTANLSPHKCYFDVDQETGKEIYIVEFKVGEFNFDEISIRTEGHRLIVQGKSKANKEKDPDEISREFRRDFTLPTRVDQTSVRAELDEDTRMLSLIGQVRAASSSPTKKTSTMTSSSVLDDSFSTLLSQPKLGSTKENRTHDHIEYEIFLGKELKDGQINIDIAGNNALNIRAIKSDWDKHGDFSHELKRQIRLPTGANADNIEHNINERTASLVIKIPTKY